MNALAHQLRKRQSRLSLLENLLPTPLIFSFNQLNNNYVSANIT